MHGKQIIFVESIPNYDTLTLRIRKVGNRWYINDQEVHLKTQEELMNDDDMSESYATYLESDDNSLSEQDWFFREAVMEAINDDNWHYYSAPFAAAMMNLLYKLRDDSPLLKPNQTITFEDNMMWMNDGPHYGRYGTYMAYPYWSEEETITAMLSGVPVPNIDD